jgi:hypothetical protein
LLAYADYIALIARGLSDLKEFFIRLERAAKPRKQDLKSMKGKPTTCITVI